MTGGLNPVPFRTGGNADNLLAAILDSLLDANGSAFSTDPDSVVAARANCDARAVFNLWQEAYRLRLATDPDRMTDPFLSRWETILGLSKVGLTDAQRRSAIKAKMQLRGKSPTYANLRDLLTQVLGDVFIGAANLDLGSAEGAIPGGLTIVGGPTLLDGDFCSHLSEVILHVEAGAGTTSAEFQASMASIRPMMDTFLPAWCDWDWHINSPGTGARGFYLTTEDNLNLEGF